MDFTSASLYNQRNVNQISFRPMESFDLFLSSVVASYC